MFSGKIKTNNLENYKVVMDKYAIKGYWCQENIDRLAIMEKIAEEKSCNVSQICLAWIIQQELKAFPIVTVSDKKRIVENAAALDIKLSRDEMERIYNV